MTDYLSERLDLKSEAISLAVNLHIGKKTYTYKTLMESNLECLSFRIKSIA